MVDFSHPSKLIGTSQILTQIVLWIISIGILDFHIIPKTFNENQYLQFLLYFICVLHQICMIRNFYCVVYTTSEIDLIPNDKKKEKQYENYTICKKCGELRSPRSHHCSICNLCIDKLDHHCIFLNNCIGRKNYKFFCSYIFTSLINTLIMIILSIYQIKNFLFEMKKEFSEKNYNPFPFQIILRTPITIIFLGFLSLIFSIGLLYFLFFHLYLLYYDYTTLELKYKQYHIDNPNKKNRKLSEKISKIIGSSNWLNIYWPD